MRRGSGARRTPTPRWSPHPAECTLQPTAALEAAPEPGGARDRRRADTTCNQTSRMTTGVVPAGMTRRSADLT